MMEADRARILRFLSRGTAKPVKAKTADKMLLDGGERGTISVSRNLLAQIIKEGQLRLDSGELVLAAEDLASENHRDIDVATLETASGPGTVAINWSESPLGQLMRRKGRDGKPFLSSDEFQAGERLRSDYTRGQIMPRLGANWEASVSSRRRAGGIADLTDSALAARTRVDMAMRSVGPELSGVLIDVCCFLKGMETVEMERGWPVRSAKVVLKAGLGMLSRHYNPKAVTNGPKVLHWGTENFRPTIT
ncbi:MAG: hypothetical protein JNK47_17330 [Mesorhizobium sp.]|nr:DUF6456 domain-containing protein [Mesorhizobium sp.]MBL8578984.1 hypothetical protein [Mesorhizobium sp.]